MTLQSRARHNDPNKPLYGGYKQKLNKHHNVANQNGLQFIPTIFSHTGQTHLETKRFVRDQIRLQLTIAEGKAKTFRVDSIFRWWSKCISATICRTASRNTLFSSARISKTINVDRQPISLNADYQEDARLGAKFIFSFLWFDS